MQMAAIMASPGLDPRVGPATHDFLLASGDVDARAKPGHDDA